MDKPECGIESGYNPYRRRGLPGQKMDKPECGIERALTPAKMPKVHLVRRWISPSAGLKALHKTHNQRARSVRRWISPSAGFLRKFGVVSGRGNKVHERNPEKSP